MNYLVFTNKGELELGGLRLMGASTKRTTSELLGFFGTGNKYALACLLRNNVQVQVASGEKLVAIATRLQMLRGQQFQELVIDGEPTGITTSIGPKWTIWMAIRELLTNAIDEGQAHGSKYSSDTVSVSTCVHAPEAGITRVYVELTSAVAEIRKDWEKYFRLPAPPTAALLPKIDSQTRVYRRGMLIYTDARPSSFDYECPDVPITEERTAEGPKVLEHCWKALDSAPIEAKQDVIREMKEFEAQLPPWHATPSDSWATVLEDDVICTKEDKAFFRDDRHAQEAKVLPDAWVSALRKVPAVDTLNKVMTSKAKVRGAQEAGNPKRENSPDGSNLKGALRLLEKVDVIITADEIILVEAFEDGWTSGLWSPSEGKIYVKRGLSFEELVHTLIHEWVHKTSGADDHERKFAEALGRLATHAILKIGGHR